MLLVIFGALMACWIAVATNVSPRPTVQTPSAVAAESAPPLPPSAPPVPQGPPSYAARNGHFGPRSSCRAFTSNPHSTASQSERDLTADRLIRFARRERRWRRASVTWAGARLSLSNMPNCSPAELHALLDSADENAPTHSSVMCSAEGWEAIECSDTAGARRVIDLEWSCDCQREVFRPNGGSFRCECEL